MEGCENGMMVAGGVVENVWWKRVGNRVVGEDGMEESVK